jgi:RecA/RadA recombinase
MTRSVTALQMLQDGAGVGRLSFGCRNLDQCTRGGIPTQGINEIVGEAGAGKTQYALTLSLQCHLPLSSKGLGGATAYLCCGEGTFPVRRLEQLSHSFEKKSGIPYTKFMENVHIEQCHNADDVVDTVVKKLPQMCASKGIRLIVIDRYIILPYYRLIKPLLYPYYYILITLLFHPYY